MEETREDAGPTEQGPSNMSWWPSDFVEKFGSVSLDSHEETLSNKESPRHFVKDVLSSHKASQTLWRTGMLSEPIPNGFYSVTPVSIDFYVTFLGLQMSLSHILPELLVIFVAYITADN